MAFEAEIEFLRFRDRSLIRLMKQPIAQSAEMRKFAHKMLVKSHAERKQTAARMERCGNLVGSLPHTP